jgi:hypothetical protein
MCGQGREIIFSVNNLLEYDLGSGVQAFSTRRDSALPYPVITGHQVHGTKVAVIDRPDLTREDLEGYDALVTALPGVAIGVRTADCVPILLFDPVKKVVAAIHSGWKGTVQRISQKTLFVLMQKFGCRPEDMRAVIGPSIGAESFQVGEEVVGYFKEQGFPLSRIWSFKSGHPEIPMHDGHHLDLVRANSWLLEEKGILPGRIQVAGIDSYKDTSFFSARREGTDCGRTINAIRILP